MPEISIPVPVVCAGDEMLLPKKNAKKSIYCVRWEGLKASHFGLFCIATHHLSSEREKQSEVHERAAHPRTEEAIPLLVLSRLIRFDSDAHPVQNS